jgi:hypothetical protein
VFEDFRHLIMHLPLYEIVVIISQLTPLLQARPLSNITNINTTIYPQYPPTIKIARIDFLGTVHSTTTHVKRDLGFQGRLGDHILLSYGDTLYSDANYSDTWRGMTSDSIALATHDPLKVVDPYLTPNGYPPQFCPLISKHGENASECALGITNVVETGPYRCGEGVLFFLLNHRPGGVNNLVGAGVAEVRMNTSSYPPRPQIRRLSQFWWDAKKEPWYGDVCALRAGDYIYAYGHGGEGNPWVYLARVRHEQAKTLACYEYWNGVDWQKERLQRNTIGEKESVF